MKIYLQTGLLSGSPHLLRMIFSYYYSIISDWLIRTNKMSLTNVRKIAVFVCTGLQGIFILALGYSGCHPTLAVIFMMAGTTVNGAVSAGPLATFVDLSPNYASILLGFCGMIVIACGFISPAIVGILTHDNVSTNTTRTVKTIVRNDFEHCLKFRKTSFRTAKYYIYKHYTNRNDRPLLASS